MKTLLLTLTLLLTGLNLRAQFPAPVAPTNNIESLRRKFRERFATNAPALTNPAVSIDTGTNPVTTIVEGTVPAPAPMVTNVITSDAFAQATAAAAARTNAGRVFSMPALRGTNAAKGLLGKSTATNTAPAGVTTIPVVTTLDTNTPGAQPAAGAIATTPGSTAAGATAPEAPEPIIAAGDIDFPAVDISQVLTIYAELVGRTVLRSTALPAQLITLKTQTPLTRSEAIQALDSVLAMNNITMVNVGDKFVKALPVGQAQTAGAVFNTRDPKKLPEADQYITQIVMLNYARPSEIIPALQPFSQIPNSILALDNSSMLIIRDYAANVKRMMELIKAIDVTAPMDFDSEVIPIKYALASDIASALGSLGAGAGASVGRSGVSSSGGAAGGRLGGAGGFGGAGGGFGGQGGLGTPGGLNTPGGLGTPGGAGGFGGAGGARSSSFNDRLSNLVKKATSAGEFQVFGQTKIIADERTNSLLVFAGKQDMDMIKSIINKLDVVLAQVLIEAIIMEVNLSDNKSLGFSYLQTKPSIVDQKGGLFAGQGGLNNVGFLNQSAFGGAGSNGLASGFSYLAHLGGNFDATVTAAASDSRVNILSRPRIQTSHAVTASLQVGETIPYVTGTYYNGLSGGPSSQYQQLFVGINLQVTPLINPDGLVVMDIVQDIQDLDGSTPISGIGDVPNTSKRTASAKVSVRDRDTIILGGFISSHKTKNKSGVPFLKDIPLLGYLFNSTTAGNTRTELMVLIRPTVLPTPESAALTATKERNRSPAIKGAEADNRLEDIKRQKEADKIKMPKDPQDN